MVDAASRILYARVASSSRLFTSLEEASTMRTLGGRHCRKSLWRKGPLVTTGLRAIAFIHVGVAVWVDNRLIPWGGRGFVSYVAWVQPCML